MTRFTAAVAFDAAIHSVDRFRCGNEALDRWLRAYAGQSQRRDAARTFITAFPEGHVLGYYTLVASEIDQEPATPEVRRGMSRHFPIPVALIARLAVHVDQQGRGLGRSLLLDALRRIIRASDELAVRAVIVEAADEPAATFYEHFGFQPSPLDPDLLMMPLALVRRILAPR